MAKIYRDYILGVLLLTGIFFGSSINAVESDSYHRSARYVWDVPVLDLGVIAKEKDLLWVVVEFKPGKCIPPGPPGVIDSEGNIVPQANPPRFREFGTYESSFKILVELVGIAPKGNETYKWKQLRLTAANGACLPPDDRTQFDESLAIYSPLGDGGTAICRINNGKEGSERFRPLFLIPPDWVPFVLPALKHYQEYQDFFAAENTSKKQKELTDLLGHENPFLAIAACRALAKGGLLTPESRKAAILAKTGLQQTIVVCLLWKNAPTSSRKEFVQELCKIIENADSAEAASGVTFGMLHINPLSRIPILKMLVSKASVWGVKTKADQDLAMIMKGNEGILKNEKDWLEFEQENLKKPASPQPQISQ